MSLSKIMLTGVCALLLCVSTLTAAEDAAVAGKIHLKPEEAKGLGVGDSIPAVTLKDDAGKEFDLAAAVKAKPTLLIFYRGGWCPYCVKHLAALKEVEAELKGMGLQILAVSPDSAEGLAKAKGKAKVEYTLLSDPGNAAAIKFDLAFKLDDATITKYRGYKIDLDEQKWTLPVPAAYIVGQDLKIEFAHVDPNYSKRIDNESLLKAAKAATAKMGKKE